MISYVKTLVATVHTLMLPFSLWKKSQGQNILIDIPAPPISESTPFNRRGHFHLRVIQQHRNTVKLNSVRTNHKQRQEAKCQK